MRQIRQSDLDKIHKELMKSAVPVYRNKKGEPVYVLRFTGTKKEHKALKKKLESYD